MNKIKLILLLLIGLVQYRLWYGDGNVLELQHLTQRIEEMRQEGAKRRERNAALEAEVMDLKQGLEAVEEQARQHLGMVKEGEVFVQVVDDHPREPEVPPAPPPEKLTPPAAKPGPAVKKPKPAKPLKPKPQATATPRLTKSQAAPRQPVPAKTAPPTRQPAPAAAQNKPQATPPKAPPTAPTGKTDP